MIAGNSGGLEQLLVYRVGGEYKGCRKVKRLRTHPCGAPVLMIVGGNLDVPALTDCGLSLRKL